MNKKQLREEFEKWYRTTDDVGSEPTSNWWLSKMAEQKKELVERVLTIIKGSRTIDETYGTGIREEAARMQALVDVQSAILEIKK